MDTALYRGRLLTGARPPILGGRAVRPSSQMTTIRADCWRGPCRHRH